MSIQPECETCRSLQTMKADASEVYDMSKYTDAVVLLERHLEENHPGANAPEKVGR
ncbi:hypothetical protein [Streptomyces sp. AJS327]|uniref:hypothetical protein n=1 Tax=Streptomyces sp. AJS327 TaxID=2545265 RepID=UPI0015DF2710|nr:hypothetical protein [Streptomyces sp. AJS327]